MHIGLVFLKISVARGSKFGMWSGFLGKDGLFLGSGRRLN